MVTADIDEITEAYALPVEGRDHPAIIFERLLTFPEHRHIRENEITVEFLFRADPKLKGGKAILGSVHVPSCQGVLRDLFEWMLHRLFSYTPDFICILDSGFWSGVSSQTREALIFHELCHIQQELDQYGSPRFNKQTGKAVYGLVEHDLGEFNAVVERYGAWSPDISDFLAAARDGGA